MTQIAQMKYRSSLGSSIKMNSLICVIRASGGLFGSGRTTDNADNTDVLLACWLPSSIIMNSCICAIRAICGLILSL
jgi:hypothetical protein